MPLLWRSWSAMSLHSQLGISRPVSTSRVALLRPVANCLSHSLLVMVPNRRLRYSYRSSLSLLFGRLCPTRWSDAHRLENNHLLDQYR